MTINDIKGSSIKSLNYVHIHDSFFMARGLRVIFPRRITSRAMISGGERSEAPAPNINRAKPVLYGAGLSSSPHTPACEFLEVPLKNTPLLFRTATRSYLVSLPVVPGPVRKTSAPGRSSSLLHPVFLTWTTSSRPSIST